MKQEFSKTKLRVLLLIGILGAILMASSDWLMIYGNTAFEGNLAWLTVGVAEISPRRNSLALFLAFPAVILYSVGLFAVKAFLTDRSSRHSYSMLTAVGLTPWLCIHLFYVMILYLFAWMMGNGQEDLAYLASEELFNHFSWLIPVGEVLMALPFVYLLWKTATAKTVLPKWMAVCNPIVFLVILKLLTSLMPNEPFRLAFTNGLMSEAMILWFAVLLAAAGRVETE